MLMDGFLGSLVFDFVKKRVPVKKIPLWYFLVWVLGMAGFLTGLFLLMVLFGGSQMALWIPILLALGIGGLLGLIFGGVDWLIWFRKDYKELKQKEGI